MGFVGLRASSVGNVQLVRFFFREERAIFRQHVTAPRADVSNVLESTGPGAKVFLAWPAYAAFNHAPNVEFDGVLGMAVGFEGHRIAADATTVIARDSDFTWNVMRDFDVSRGDERAVDALGPRQRLRPLGVGKGCVAEELLHILFPHSLIVLCK